MSKNVASEWIGRYMYIINSAVNLYTREHVCVQRDNDDNYDQIYVGKHNAK